MCTEPIQAKPSWSSGYGSHGVRSDDLQIKKLPQPQQQVVCTHTRVLASRLQLDAQLLLDELRS